ncbi:NAD-dependent epimerase/dehydratase family protein [bacterium]|jgi:uncharacterized protein YbjT (DUF2867 family)|nr:NAD-dependent epimerase/dehydratase family protein [bacterium]
MRKIMLTGASGYIGGLLLDRLLALGFEVQALVRNPARFRKTHPSLCVFAGDVRNPLAVREAMRGCELAYYLVHGLEEASSFEYQEALSAQVFTEAANQAGLSRIIYLGGLGEGSGLSPHLRSRQLTGKILSLGKTPVTEFRASIVLGRGSASFEMLRLLAGRLPFFVEPRNLMALCQPIHVDDLLAYLVRASEIPASLPPLIEVGGADQLPYAELLLRVARHSGIRRRVIPVPEIDLRLLAEVFELVCPEYARLGRRLMESLSHSTLVNHPGVALAAFPAIRPVGLDRALDCIGPIQSEVLALIGPEHTKKVLRMFRDRFPQFRFLPLG